MGEILLVCSLITLLLVVYFIYIKEREDKNNQTARNRQAQNVYKNDARHSKYSGYNSRLHNLNESFHSNNFAKSGEYLKFLKFKNTPPPQDLKPKKLKYENYNNLQIFENYYNNYHQRQLNILTPTPFKHDQVLAGNIQIENKIKNVYQINTNANLNYNQKEKSNVELNNNRNNQKKIKPIEGYVSKYPVDISYKKRQITKYDLLGEMGTYDKLALNNKSNHELPAAGLNNNQGNDLYLNNYNTNRNYATSSFSLPNPINNNFNKISYKVINAEEFLKKRNVKNENSREKNKTLSISPLGVINNIQNDQTKLNPNFIYPNDNNKINKIYNNNIKQEKQNLNYPRNNYMAPSGTAKEEEIIPRKLRFSDSSFNKFNLVTNKKDDEWFSPLN